MDRDLLRIVIIALGALVIVGMWLWHVLNKNKSRRGRGFFQDDDLLDSIDESLVIKGGDDDFEIVPLGSAVDDELPETPVADESAGPQHKAEPTVSGLPKIIQFSIVSRAGDGFNGMDLAAAFDDVGLRYADIKIFERVDSSNLVDFGVASMVPPGTFPDSNLEAFNCPGIVLFMQPREVDDPVVVFDDFIDTVHRLSSKLDGIEWDETRQPLSEAKIQSLRGQMLRH